MSTRYDDRDEERDYGRSRNYGRRSESDYDRSYGGGRSQGRYGRGREESDREDYTGENRWSGSYGGTFSRREYGSGREGYRPGSENDLDYSSDRESRYGSFGRGYDVPRQRYSDDYSQQYNYPTGFRSGQTYGERGRRQDYDYNRDRYRSAEERGWWDRFVDELASWFGAEDAERRRRSDEQRQRYRGHGPKGYRRSDERIRDDVNDRLSEGYLDASDIEVTVTNAEVTLTGTVNNRSDKRRAEDIAEDVLGVSNVENRLRVKQSELDRYPSLDKVRGATGTSTSSTSGTTGTTGTTGTARGTTAGG
jgi:osmotically-inducible protein OsmY